VVVDFNMTVCGVGGVLMVFMGGALEEYKELGGVL
jgi:hypothetical protein